MSYANTSKLIGTKLIDPPDYRPEHIKRFGDQVNSFDLETFTCKVTDEYGNITIDTKTYQTKKEKVCPYCKSVKLDFSECINCGAP